MVNQTPFYPKRTLAVSIAYNRLERELFSRWAGFYSGKEITVTNCEGRKIHLTGDAEFVGSAREIFWDSFFEPDFKKVIAEQIEQTVKDCQARPELSQAALDETVGLLRELARKVYERMAEVDQRLRGKGDPNIVQRLPVQDKIKSLNADIDVYIGAAKKLLSRSLRSSWLNKVFKTSWLARYSSG